MNNRASLPMTLRFVFKSVPVAALAAASLCVTGPSAVAASLQWAGATTGLGGGVSEIWDTSATNFYDGLFQTAWPNGGNDDATFGGTAGTVTLGAAISAHNLTFTTTDYTLLASTLTLGGTAPTITTSGTVSTVISSSIGGTAGYVKAGTGTLTVSGLNTVTGTISVNQGILVTSGTANQTASLGGTGVSVAVADGASLQIGDQNRPQAVGLISLTGSGADGNGALYFQGGGSRLANSSGTISFSGPTTIGVAAGVINGTGSTAVNLIGRINGSGGLTVKGPGTLSYEGSVGNNYTGLTTVTGGATLNLSKSGSGSSRIAIRDNVTVDPGATLGIARNAQFLTSGTTTAPIVITANGTLDMNNYFSATNFGTDTNSTIGALAGSGRVTTSTILTNTNPVTVLTLAANDGGSRNFSGVIEDTNVGNLTQKIAIVKSGTSTQVFSGASTFSGGTTVNGGILSAEADGSLGLGNVTVNGGSLNIWSGVAGVSNVIADSATLTIGALGMVGLNGGSETVGGLVINGITFGNGTYTSVTNPSFINGAGSIVVVPEPQVLALAAGGLLFVLVFGRRRSNARA